MSAGVIAMLGAAFGATKAVAELWPKFSEKQKKKIEGKYNTYISLKKRFNKAAVEFEIGSNSDELLALSDEVRIKKEEIHNLYRLYAKEISS